MTVRLKRIKLFGEGVYADSAVITRQRRLNCYLEVRKDREKSQVVLKGTPGLRYLFNGGNASNLPLRGMVGTDTALYGVSGSIFQSFSSTGTVLNSGAIGTSSGNVGLALNPTQVLIVDGSAGYIYTTATGVITQIGGAFPNGAKTGVYCNGFFACEQPGTNQFFVSALNDGTNFPGLSFAAAVQTIDGIMACDTVGGLLVIFSSGHVEFWQNQGLNPEPFVYIQNSASMIGLEAVYGRVHCGDALLYLAHTGGGSFQNSSGSFQIAKIEGYSVKIVSTDDIDEILQTMARTSTIADCTAFSYQRAGHQFAQFNFPTAGRSLLYDVSTGFWSEVQSGVTSSYAARHLGNFAAQAFGQPYVCDYSNGNVYTPDPTVYTDNGNTIVRELVTPCALEDYNVFRASFIYLDMKVGHGLPTPGVQGYDPRVELSIARDNRNFGAPRYFSLGKQGQDMTRVASRRWGRGRMMNLRVRMTDPVPFEIAAGAVRTSRRAAA